MSFQNKLIFSICLLAFGFSAKAQIEPFLQGGLNHFSFLSFNNIKGEKDFRSWESGNVSYQFGYGLYVPFNKKIGLTACFLYSDYKLGEWVNNSDRNEFFQFMGLPVSFNYNLLKGTRIGIRMEIQYLLNKSLNSYDFDFENSLVRRFNNSVGIEILQKIGNFGLELNCNKGLINLMAAEIIENNELIGRREEQTFVVQLNVKYNFRVK